MAEFRAVRHKTESQEFAFSEGDDVAPTQLIDKKTWARITHLPDDVAIRTSDHNGHRLELLYSLWGDWIMATGDPEKSDKLFDCSSMRATPSNVPTFFSCTATTGPRWGSFASRWSWS